MRNQLVYDVPTRLFHWIFAGLFSTAYVIASTADESPIFPWHMMVGLTAGLAVVLRLVWGFVGTRHARFTSFMLSPKALLGYLKDLTCARHAAVAGHNPASSWVALILMGLALGLGATGFLMTRGANPEAYEEIHEFLADTFLVIVVLHIAGVALHMLRHRDGFLLSMVDGRKQHIAASEEISSARPLVGLVFVAILAGFAANLARHYDANAQSLSVFGFALQLGEKEGDTDEDSEKHQGRPGGQGDGKDDDDD